jgi:hypothetical protein
MNNDGSSETFDNCVYVKDIAGIEKCLYIQYLKETVSNCNEIQSKDKCNSKVGLIGGQKCRYDGRVCTGTTSSCFDVDGENILCNDIPVCLNITSVDQCIHSSSMTCEEYQIYGFVNDDDDCNSFKSIYG